jgi:hypothetical protein
MVPMQAAQGPAGNGPQPTRREHAKSSPAGEQAVRRVRVRQASVTSATLTPAERASLRAIAALNRPSSPPRAALPPAASGRPRDGRTGTRPPALRRTTGLVLTAAGAILWLAVHATVAFVAIQRAGLVLLVTGLLWLWLGMPDKRDRIRRRFNQFMRFLEWDPAAAQEARCSLEDLLEPRSGAAPDGHRD